MNIKEILKVWLVKHGFDGLYYDECGCWCDDLMPCDCPNHDCKPGWTCEIDGEPAIGPAKPANPQLETLLKAPGLPYYGE